MIVQNLIKGERLILKVSIESLPYFCFFGFASEWHGVGERHKAKEWQVQKGRSDKGMDFPF